MRILTWNIQWGRGADGRVDLARCVATARACDADIYCLQEVAVNHPNLPGGGAGDQVTELAASFPEFVAAFAVASDLPAAGGGRRQFGNLILARLPLLQVFRHLLPWPADPDVPSMPRVALEAVVDAPWGPLRVTTTHLEYYSARQRAAQVDGLLAIHGEACGHAGPLRPDRDVDAPFAALPRPASAVFCGDFNFPPEAPEYARLQSPRGASPALTDAWSAVFPGVPHTATVGTCGAEWPDHPYCCDFMFVTPDLLPRLASIEVITETAASDHQPLLLILD